MSDDFKNRCLNLDGYITGELSHHDTIRFKEHILACRQCRELIKPLLEIAKIYKKEGDALEPAEEVINESKKSCVDLDDCINGEMSSNEVARFTEHLKVCRQCRGLIVPLLAMRKMDKEMEDTFRPTEAKIDALLRKSKQLEKEDLQLRLEGKMTELKWEEFARETKSTWLSKIFRLFKRN